MEKNPLISIVLPVFNGEKYIRQSIESCLYQTYSNTELIVVNDFSTDSTLQIIEKYAELDSRVRVVCNKENKMLPACLNIGHKLAKGDFITWTSDDNILKPNFLECLISSLFKDEVDVVYSNYDIISEDGNFKRIHITGPTEYILYGNKIGASFLYRKEVFQELGGYDESLFLLEDYDFWLRASVKFKFYYLNDSLYQYRLHSDSLTSKIHFDEEKKKKYQLGVVEMFKKISHKFSWDYSTTELLTNNLLGEKVDICKYLNNKKTIEKDLLKFNPKDFDGKIILGQRFLLRNQLLRNNCNFKTLVKVLKKDANLLFSRSFSKKTTLNYILNSLFG